MGRMFSALLPVVWGFGIFGGPEKAEMLAKSWDSWLFHFAVQALRDRPVQLGFGKMLAEQRIKLSLGERKKNALGSDN